MKTINEQTVTIKPQSLNHMSKKVPKLTKATLKLAHIRSFNTEKQYRCLSVLSTLKPQQTTGHL